MPGAVDPAAGQPADGPQAEAGHNPTPHQRRRTSVTHRRPSGDKPSPQRPRLEEWRRHRSGPGKVARSLQSRTREPTTGKGVRHGALRNAAATDPSPRLAASPLDRHKPGCTGTHSVTRSTSTRRHNIAGHNSDRRKHGELCTRWHLAAQPPASRTAAGTFAGKACLRGVPSQPRACCVGHARGARSCCRLSAAAAVQQRSPGRARSPGMAPWPSRLRGCVGTAARPPRAAGRCSNQAAAWRGGGRR